MPEQALLISCFDWYRERLAPIRDLLLSKGHAVTVLTSDFDHLHTRPVEEKIPECSYVHVPPYRRNLSFRRIVSHLAFGREVGKQLESLRPDLVYCLLPPNCAADRCRKYKQAHPDTRLILDLIDLWPESMPLGWAKNTFPAKIWRRWRDDSIAVADHVFTECELYQKKLEAVLDPSKTSVLTLFKEMRPQEKQLVQEMIRRRRAEKENLQFAYLGSMNNIIDVDGICSVLRVFQESGYVCTLHAVGDGENRERFQSAVQATGCRAHFYGPLYDEKKKIEILAPCDYAFNMMKEGVVVGLTIKSIDYLSYGLPLINNIKGDTWALIEDSGIGVNVGGKEKWAFSLKEIDHRDVIEVFDRKFSKDAFLAAVNGGLT